MHWLLYGAHCFSLLRALFSFTCGRRAYTKWAPLREQRQANQAICNQR